MQIIRDVTTTVEPVSEPITLSEAKNYLKVDFDDWGGGVCSCHIFIV